MRLECSKGRRGGCLLIFRLITRKSILKQIRGEEWAGGEEPGRPIID